MIARSLAVLLFCLGLLVTSQAQFNSPSTTAVLDSGGKPAYSGSGDVITTNWKAWWGFRAFTSATRGTKLANVCDSTGGVDVTCVDMVSSPVTGYLVVTSPGGVGCAANCTVKTLYDQSAASNCAGACDVTNATVATRPVLLPNCLNGRACMVCQNGVFQYLQTGANFGAVAQPFSVSGVANRTGRLTSNSNITGAFGAAVQTGFSATADNALIYAGTLVPIAGVVSNANHAINATYNGASSIYNIDGSTATVNPGAGTYPGGETISVCSFSTGGNEFNGNWLEAGVNSGNLSAGNLASLNTNQHAAYGGF